MVSPSPHYKCHLQFHFLFTKYKVGIHAEVNGSHTHTTTRVPKYIYKMYTEDTVFFHIFPKVQLLKMS